ncbi:hypothetical protein BaRGS_00002621 [Batillaria attramentaria]|uniref:RAMA domain-containing protein n=1 Tax=Batillaria attramentaria TaxID=370345 RepID=A0ABD0M3I2_9CAEN
MTTEENEDPTQSPCYDTYASQSLFTPATTTGDNMSTTRECCSCGRTVCEPTPQQTCDTMEDKPQQRFEGPCNLQLQDSQNNRSEIQLCTQVHVPKKRTQQSSSADSTNHVENDRKSSCQVVSNTVTTLEDYNDMDSCSVSCLQPVVTHYSGSNMKPDTLLHLDLPCSPESASLQDPTGAPTTRVHEIYMSRCSIQNSNDVTTEGTNADSIVIRDARSCRPSGSNFFPVISLDETFPSAAKRCRADVGINALSKRAATSNVSTIYNAPSVSKDLDPRNRHSFPGHAVCGDLGLSAIHHDDHAEYATNKPQHNRRDEVGRLPFAESYDRGKGGDEMRDDLSDETVPPDDMVLDEETGLFQMCTRKRKSLSADAGTLSAVNARGHLNVAQSHWLAVSVQQIHSTVCAKDTAAHSSLLRPNTLLLEQQGQLGLNAASTAQTFQEATSATQLTCSTQILVRSKDHADGDRYSVNPSSPNSNKNENCSIDEKQAPGKQDLLEQEEEEVDGCTQLSQSILRPVPYLVQKTVVVHEINDRGFDMEHCKPEEQVVENVLEDSSTSVQEAAHHPSDNTGKQFKDKSGNILPEIHKREDSVFADSNRVGTSWTQNSTKQDHNPSSGSEVFASVVVSTDQCSAHLAETPLPDTGVSSDKAVRNTTVIALSDRCEEGIEGNDLLSYAARMKMLNSVNRSGTEVAVGDNKTTELKGTVIDSATIETPSWENCKQTQACLSPESTDLEHTATNTQRKQDVFAVEPSTTPTPVILKIVRAQPHTPRNNQTKTSSSEFAAVPAETQTKQVPLVVNCKRPVSPSSTVTSMADVFPVSSKELLRRMAEKSTKTTVEPDRASETCTRTLPSSCGLMAAPCYRGTTEMEPAKEPDGGSAKVPRKAQMPRKFADLVTAGIVNPGNLNLSLQWKGCEKKASVHEDGRVKDSTGLMFSTPITWYRAVTGFQHAKRSTAYAEILHEGQTLTSLCQQPLASRSVKQVPGGKASGLQVRSQHPCNPTPPNPAILANCLSTQLPGYCSKQREALSVSHPSSETARESELVGGFAGVSSETSRTAKKTEISVFLAREANGEKVNVFKKCLSAQAIISSIRRLKLVSDEEICSHSVDSQLARFWAADFASIQMSESVWASVNDWS